MSKLTTHVLPIVILIFAIACLSCDDYNIVEPRFYDEDSLVVFAECGYDPFGEPEEVANSLSSMNTKWVVPSGFAISGCWIDRAEGVLAVFISLPIASSFTVSLLNSGGGLETVVYGGSAQAGLVGFPCSVDDDGVYALSLQTKHATVVVWFEVK